MPFKFNIFTGKLDNIKADADIDHTKIANIGTKTHTQIDTHIADASDPHGTTLTQTNLDVTGLVGIGVSGLSGTDLYIKRSSSDTTQGHYNIFTELTQSVATAQLIISGATTAKTTHSTGLSSTIYGYLGGTTVAGNGDVLLAYGVYAQTTASDGVTANVTYMIGCNTYVDAQDATVTYGISSYNAAPVVDTGSITDAIAIYAEKPSSGTNNWSGMFEGDVQINSDNKLLLEGALGVKGDTYLVYDSVGTTMDFFVNNVETFNMSSTQVEFLKTVNMSNITGDVFKFPADATDPTAGGGAAAGRIPVNIGGVTKYLAYY